MRASWRLTYGRKPKCLGVIHVGIFCSGTNCERLTRKRLGSSWCFCQMLSSYQNPPFPEPGPSDLNRYSTDGVWSERFRCRRTPLRRSEPRKRSGTGVVRWSTQWKSAKLRCSPNCVAPPPKDRRTSMPTSTEFDTTSPGEWMVGCLFRQAEPADAELSPEIYPLTDSFENIYSPLTFTTQRNITNANRSISTWINISN